MPHRFPTQNHAGREARRARGEGVDPIGSETFRSLFDQAPVGVAVVSLGLRFIRVNDALCAAGGLA